jgi:hypothetical protein
MPAADRPGQPKSEPVETQTVQCGIRSPGAQAVLAAPASAARIRKVAFSIVRLGMSAVYVDETGYSPRGYQGMDPGLDRGSLQH